MKRRLASRPSARPRFGWTLTTVVLVLAFYLLALNSDFYQLTSPIELSWHVTLRKIFSVGAFTVVAFLIRKTLAERGIAGSAIAVVIGGALFSGAIEIGQYRNGSTEGFGWNAIDVGCGALGGAIAAFDLLVRRSASKKPPTRISARRRRNFR